MIRTKATKRTEAIEASSSGSELDGEFRQFLCEIQQLVAASPGAELCHGISNIVIPAADPAGFDIKLIFERDGVRLMFDAVALDVSTQATTLDLVEAALHSKARVKIDAVGGRPRQWTIERMDASGRWSTECATGHLSFQWWRKSETYYKINGVWPRAANRESQTHVTTVAPTSVQTSEYAPAY